MNLGSSDTDLIERYFRDELKPGDFDELQRLLSSDKRAAEQFVARARLESELCEHFKLAREEGRAEGFAQTATAHSNARRYRWVVLGNAALLALCVGSFWWVASRNKPVVLQPASDGKENRVIGRVVSGKVVDDDDMPVQSLLEGHEVRCIEAAEVELSDTSRVSLADNARLKIRRGVEGQRAVVEVLGGTVKFGVIQAPEKFVVNTSLGSIRDSGSQFSVELRPVESQTQKGAENMKLSTVMLVVVAAGLVEVNVDGTSYNLSGGQSRAFGEENIKKKPQAPTHTINGSIAAVGADSVTLSSKNEKGPHSEEIPVGPNTKIFIETDEDETVVAPGKKGTRPKQIPGTLASLVVGERARATVSAGGETLEILQLRHQDNGKKKGDNNKEGGNGGGNKKGGDKSGAKKGDAAQF